mgnify:CR=1 FL=1
MRRRVGAQRRVGAHQAVHVRPVFVETRAEGGGDPRAGNVRAAAGEGLNFAVGAASVKAGNYREVTSQEYDELMRLVKDSSNTTVIHRRDGGDR